LKGELKPSELQSLTFKENWLAHFSHSFSQSVATLAPESFKEGIRRNLFSPFSYRRVGSDSIEKSLKWCESKGVQVLRNVELKDISFDQGKNLSGFEVRTQRPGIFKASQFVICLTAEEAGMISSKIQTALFGTRIQEPEWAWVRYRLQFQGKGPMSQLTRKQLPHHCLVVDDLWLPWSHENLIVLQQTSSKDQFDAWIKIPNTQRFHSQYLTQRAEKIKQVLENKLPENEVMIIDLPLESKATFQKVGPTRHPVFSRALHLLRMHLKIKNISFDSPEYWESLSWEGQFAHQEKIYQQLKSWWDHKE
jgi:hypothetical protein